MITDKPDTIRPAHGKVPIERYAAEFMLLELRSRDQTDAEAIVVDRLKIALGCPECGMTWHSTCPCADQKEGG